MRKTLILLSLLLLSGAVYADEDPAPPVKACHTLTDLQKKIKDAALVEPLTLYGQQALAVTDFINNKVGERTTYKADTLVAIPIPANDTEKKATVLVWFVYNDCIEEPPIRISVQAFLAAVNSYNPQPDPDSQ